MEQCGTLILRHFPPMDQCETFSNIYKALARGGTKWNIVENALEYIGRTLSNTCAFVEQRYLHWEYFHIVLKVEDCRKL